MKHISVYARARSPYWYAAFPDPRTGVRVYRSTEIPVHAPQSKRRALNWARSQAGEGPLLRDEPKGTKGWGWVEPWLTLRYRTQAKSLSNALDWWHWLELYFIEQGIGGPRSLTRELALDYIPWRMAQKKRSGKMPAYNSALQEIKFLGRILREARARDATIVNVCERLGLRKEKPSEKPEITDEQISLIRERLHQLEGALPLRERWMTIQFEIALHQGCRVAETISPLDRYELDAGTVRLHIKGDRWGTVPLHPGLRPLIQALKDSGATHTCRPPARYTREWSRFFKGRDERNQEAFLPELTFHCTRVTVVTRLARAGIPIQQAMGYVLHADELIHKIYQRLKPNDLRGCHSALRYPDAPIRGDNTPPQNQDDPPTNATDVAVSSAAR